MLEAALDELVDQTCWHVSAGGVTWPSFMLALGKKIPRSIPLKNEAQPLVFRENDPSVSLLIWCSWRLELASGMLGSSDGGPASESLLGQLTGKTVRIVERSEPAHDLTVLFDDLTRLKIFSDHVDSEECSFEQNWELTTPNYEISAGPGSTIEAAERSV